MTDTMPDTMTDSPATHRPRPRRAGPLLLTAVLALGAAACGDSTGPDDDHDDDHGEPAAVRLILGGQEIARADLETSTGEIHVHPGEETGPITVEFLDDDEDVLDPDPEEFYLEVEVDDDAVAGFEQESPGAFVGHVDGHEAGRTVMRFKLMHGTVGAGHEDWVSADVDVHVEEH